MQMSGRGLPWPGSSTCGSPQVPPIAHARTRAPGRHAEWREDLKELYRAAGVAGRPTAFLLDEPQIKLESFLEDVNNILTSGEVPNLFPKVRRLLGRARVAAPTC